MSRIIHKYFNCDTSPENKTLILNSEWKKPQNTWIFSMLLFLDEISSSGHDAKGTVKD